MLQLAARKAVALYRRARLSLLGTRPTWRPVAPHLMMEIDPVDWMDRSFFLGTYDPWLLHLLDRVIRPGDTAFDIGAQKGYVSLQLARRVGPKGHVLAFEPDPRARVCLERHRERNHLQAIRIFPHALGADSGEVTFALSKQLGWSSFFPNAEAMSAVVERVPVSVRRLDDLVADGTIAVDPARFSFAKLDVEGTEPLVLEGMARLLRETQPVLWIEINRSSLAAAGFTPHDVERPLRAAGYALWGIRRFRRIAAPRLRLEPLPRLDEEAGEVFDVLASRVSPPGLATVRRAPARAVPA
jgi:FkbM family methyltransferase